MNFSSHFYLNYKMAWKITYRTKYTHKIQQGPILEDITIAEAWIKFLEDKYGKDSHWLEKA